MLSLAGFAWIPRDASRPLFSDVTLRLDPGECALLSGATGSGKSTLLRAIAGAQPPGGTPSGELRVEGRTALLFQNADTQLLFSTVEEEVASGLRGARGDRARVESTLAAHGLAALAHRAVEDLSAGERQRVLLAALLASEPSLLLLDEPTRALDLDERARLVSALEGVVSRGCAVLVAEHVTEPFHALASRDFALEDGRLVERRVDRSATQRPPAHDRPARSAIRRASRSASGAARPDPSHAEPLIRCRAIEVCSADSRTRLPALDLELCRGDRVLICGANGAGKTTLLGALAGTATLSRGRIELAPQLAAVVGDARQPATGRVALVLQCPPRNLFANSVRDELAFTLERAGWGEARIARRVQELLDLCDLARYRDRSPLRLSFGEQQRVAIAAALAAEPALLLLDEPCSGLDARSRARLLELLDREQARTGMAIAIAAPHAEGLEKWAQRCIELSRASTAGRAPIAETVHPSTAARRGAAGRACHFRDTGSALHRLGVGWKLVAVALGGAAAIAAREPLALALLLAAWMAGYRLARLSAAELWQDMRWLLAQGALIVALSSLREGAQGAAAGLRAAAQIALFFLPGALLLRTTPTGRLLESLQRALPARLAFALATSLRFVPFFAREAHEIVSVQRLRGARLHARDAWRPRAWRDAIECVGAPLAARAIHTANEVALAAEVRGISSASDMEG